MEETMAGFSSNSTTTNAVKGKRTKRQRLHLPPPTTATATLAAPTSSSSSAESPASTTTEEDENLANCLILLAQGRTSPETGTTEQPAPPATTCAGAGGFYVYECKTCNKSFPSFQALGGHRASHKKPKLASPPAPAASTAEDGLQISMNCFSTSAVSTNNHLKTRVHECSICGSEFSSGQALGGHMRRHRPLAEIKKEKNVLSLDLNLPAPADDDGCTVAFPLERLANFSASALVDCHY